MFVNVSTKVLKVFPVKVRERPEHLIFHRLVTVLLCDIITSPVILNQLSSERVKGLRVSLHSYNINTKTSNLTENFFSVIEMFFIRLESKQK